MKQTMKRILAGILFFAIFFAMIQYAGYIGRPYFEGAYNYNIWEHFYQEDENSLNVVTIGSSAIYRYWMPTLAYEEQGFTSFTIGSNRQPFGTVPYILEEVAKTQKPDVAVVEIRSLLNQHVYEVTDHEFADADMQSWVLGIIASGMHHSSTRFNLIHENYVDTEGDCELYWHVPVLKWHSLEYTLPLEERMKRISPEKDLYKSTYLHPGVKIMPAKNPEKKLKDGFTLTDQHKAIIDKVVQYAADNDMELLFLSTPYYMDEELASMQKSFADYVGEKQYPYLDLSDAMEEIGLDHKTDFYNTLHTNTVGAEKITRYVAKYLADNYDLDNVTLSKTQKKEWKSSCKAWNKEYAKAKKTWEKNCEKALKKASK